MLGMAGVCAGDYGSDARRFLKGLSLSGGLEIFATDVGICRVPDIPFPEIWLRNVPQVEVFGLVDRRR